LWIKLAHDWDRYCEHGNEISLFTKCEEFFDKLRSFSRRLCYMDLVRQLIPQPLRAATATAASAAAATTTKHIKVVGLIQEVPLIVPYL
jgi:hypothetical protein